MSVRVWLILILLKVQAIYNPEKYANDRRNSEQIGNANPGIVLISQRTLDDFDKEMDFTQTGIFVLIHKHLDQSKYPIITLSWLL